MHKTHSNKEETAAAAAAKKRDTRTHEFDLHHLKTINTHGYQSIPNQLKMIEYEIMMCTRQTKKKTL